MDQEPEEVDWPDCDIGGEQFLDPELDGRASDVSGGEGGVIFHEGVGWGDKEDDLNGHVYVLVDGFVLVVLLLPDPLDDCHPLEDNCDHGEDGE